MTDKKGPRTPKGAAGDSRRFWVDVIGINEAKGELKRRYAKSVQRQGYVGTPPLLLSTRQELRSVLGAFYSPEMEGKRLLPMAVWEQLMVVVARANQCQYCAATHTLHAEKDHGVNHRRLEALLSGDWKRAGLDYKTAKLMEYAKKVTLRPYAVEESDIAELREAGYGDPEILEATVVICNCNATNRLVSSLSNGSVPDHGRFPAQQQLRTLPSG